MKETIHYISDFTYIKDKGHLREVINYLTRNLKLDNSLTTINKDRRDLWLQRAQYEKSKRKDSQIALRFNVALPNDQRDNPEFRKKVFKKLVEIFDIPDEHLDIAFHLDTQNNYHAHILIYPRGKDGKKLRLSKNDLKRIHKEWDLFLQNEGYTIRKNGNNKVVKKSIWQYMKEKTKEMGYIPIPDFLIDEKMLEEGKKSFLRKLKRLSKKLNEDTEEAKKIKILIKKIEEDKIKLENMIETKEYLYSKPLEPLGNPINENLNNLNDNWNNWNNGNNRMKIR